MTSSERGAIGQQAVHPSQLPKQTTARRIALFTRSALSCQRAARTFDRARWLSLVSLLSASSGLVACGDALPPLPPSEMNELSNEPATEPVTEQPTTEMDLEPATSAHANALEASEDAADVDEQEANDDPEELDTTEEPPDDAVDGAGLGAIDTDPPPATTTEEPEDEPPASTDDEDPAPSDPVPVEPDPPEMMDDPVPEPEPEPEPEEPAGPIGPGPVVTPPTSGGNLLSNPGFEDGTTGWEAWGGQISAVADPAHSGGFSGRVTGRTEDWNGGVRDILALVDAGKTYQASAWATTSGSGQKVALTVQAVCGGTEDYISVASSSASSGTWAQLRGTFTVPSCSLQSLTLYVEGPSAGIDLFIDDMSLTEQ